MRIGFRNVLAGATATVAATALATPASYALGPPPPWTGFAGDAQHTGRSTAAPQPLTSIHWKVKVDHRPSCCDDGPIAHYASPMITSGNTVVVPVRLGPKRGFVVKAVDGADGTKLWEFPTDYTPPLSAEYEWPPPIPASLVGGQVAVAGAGGTILLKSYGDPAAAPHRIAFYGIDRYRAHRAAFRKAVQITTPITTGADGTLYFGFSATKAAPGKLHDGLARIPLSGKASWISARRLGGTDKATSIALNGAPALSNDEKIGYVPVVTGSHGRLVGFNATTLRSKFVRKLKDPQTHTWAQISGSSTSTPTVGPDGDVFYGVLGNPIIKHDVRGWLLHFDSTLLHRRTPGSFGWDSTVSVVPASSVPSYAGTSSYLLVSKYNNYDIGPHGDGRNEIALLDPHATQQDRFSKVQVLEEVRTVLSPVHPPDTPKGSRYEWCINSIAVDPTTGSAIANNEDGNLDRWDLDTGTLVDSIQLGPPAGQAYTMTVIGPDGTAYGMTNAVLYAVGG
jgi:hypothetical protein